jgi:hypothetical protein
VHEHVLSPVLGTRLLTLNSGIILEMSWQKDLKEPCAFAEELGMLLSDSNDFNDLKYSRGPGSRRISALKL